MPMQTSSATKAPIVTVEAAVRALTTFHGTLLVEAVDPFVQAAVLVLQEECRVHLTAAKPTRHRSSVTHGDWNATIAVLGKAVAGLVVYSADTKTAHNLASALMGEPVTSIDRTAAGALGELANMITGRASMGLEENGFPSHISPPQLLHGAGSFLSPRPLTWLDLPLMSDLGRFDVWIALRQA
ncbi:MAG: hypothetical protein C0506_11000 [Anaerolinea sp.]|nr:hypothetical protein [Anaerolinea sp.]